MCHYPPVDPTISASLNHSWPMIHLVVYLISAQGYLTFLNRYGKLNHEGGRKEQTNKHRLDSAPSARKGEVYETLFVHSVLLWANVSLYSSENSQKATSITDLTSGIGPAGICRWTGPSSRLSDFCWLLSSLSHSHLPDWPVPFTASFKSLLLPSSDSVLLLTAFLSVDSLLQPTFVDCVLLLTALSCWLISGTFLPSVQYCVIHWTTLHGEMQSTYFKLPLQEER